MTPAGVEEIRVLAVDPTSKGFGFAIFEGSTRLIDWGVKHATKDKNRASVNQVGELVALYQPDILLVEDSAAPGSRRCERVCELMARLRSLASTHKTRFRKVSMHKVRKFFAAEGARTKRQIAVSIAGKFPELEPKLPPLRKPWMSEDERMAIFDAAAFALTFLELTKKEGMAQNPPEPALQLAYDRK
jgi:hypothetical protein